MQQRTAGGEVGAIVAQTTVSWFGLILTAFIGAGDGDADGGFLGFLIGPILLNCVVLVAGLPLRLSDSRWAFLRRHGEIMLGVALVGFVFAVVGFATVTVWSMFVGMFLIAFGLVHAWPPFAWLWDDDAQTAKKVARGRAAQHNP